MKEIRVKDFQRGDYGHDLAPDGRTLGVYFDDWTATHTFATPEDARAADDMISFLLDLLDGVEVHYAETWPAGQRPADVPLAPALAAAFAQDAQRAAAMEEVER